jgi:hypothetical protein
LWLIPVTHSIYRTIPSKRSTNVKNVEGVEDVVHANNGRDMSVIVISDAVISIPAPSRRVPPSQIEKQGPMKKKHKRSWISHPLHISASLRFVKHPNFVFVDFEGIRFNATVAPNLEPEVDLLVIIVVFIAIVVQLGPWMLGVLISGLCT